jgi:hypothetical protein
MNWRNPFLNAYLAVTVIGAGALGYFLYSSYSHFAEVSENYDSQVAELQKLQNRTPFPSDANNQAYAELTKQYRAEYDKLLARVTKMQKPLESITPQTFQDRLRAYVTEVQAAAKENGVKMDETFYLGFDKYRDNLPSNEAASPLARELDAIRLIVDKLITFKVKQINGIVRQPLAEEGGRAPATPTAQPPGRPRPGAASAASDASKIIGTNTFDISFESDQSRLRQVLNAAVTADLFFIIRNLNIENSNLEGPKRVADAVESATPPPTDALADAQGQPATPAPDTMRLLVGRETLTTILRIEMITFTPPAAKK